MKPSYFRAGKKIETSSNWIPPRFGSGLKPIEVFSLFILHPLHFILFIKEIR